MNMLRKKLDVHESHRIFKTDRTFDNHHVFRHSLHQRRIGFRLHLPYFVFIQSVKT